MDLWKRMGALAAVVVLLGGAAAAAEEAAGRQSEGETSSTYLRHDERDWEDEGRSAFGIAVGLVNLDSPGVADDVEVYWSANVRFAVGPSRHSSRQGWRGYLEPELGYWESSGEGGLPSAGRDVPGTGFQQTGRTALLLGVNIVGVMPWQAVDFFVGAGVGIHFIDTDRRVFSRASATAPIVVTDQSVSEEALGVNAHFGVDIAISRRASFYGVGRFDIVDDDSNALDPKAYLGLRYRFGGHRGRSWSPDDD